MEREEIVRKVIAMLDHEKRIYDLFVSIKTSDATCFRQNSIW